jgi:hypothetical protein
MIINPYAFASSATLFLDETGLGSSVAAFSVRLLRAAYAGYFFRLRRSSDNAEADFGDDGTGEFTASSTAANGSNPLLDGQDVTTFFAAQDGFVVSWLDQSGNARNAAQATASAQPQIIATGAINTGSNGKPALIFDGSNDVLNTATFTFNQPLSFDFVAYQTTWTGDDYFLDGSGVGNTIQFAQRTATPTVGLGATQLTSADWPVVTWAVLTCVLDNTSSVIAVDNLTETTGTAGTGNPGGVCIGAFGAGVGYFANFQTSEAVFWASALDSTARGTSKTNVNAFFALF